MDKYFSVPYLKVNPSATIQYNLLEDGFGNVVRFQDPLKVEENLRNNGTNGYISAKAKKRLADSVDWINELTSWKKMNVDGQTVKYKMTFMTLTLPSPQFNDTISELAGELMNKDIRNMVHSGKGIMNYIDDVIKKYCLNQFLTELRQQYGMKLYIWRAEAQKNGNIHFHIITDIGIHYQVIRRIWNRILDKFGYVEGFRAEHINLTLDQYRAKYPVLKKIKGKYESIEDYNSRTLNAYTQGCQTDWSHPNSTDIHSVRRVRDLRKYVTKYLCKEVNNITDRLIYGRLWFISQALSEARNMTDMIYNSLDEEIEMLSNSAGDRSFRTEHCFILQLNMSEIRKLGGLLIPAIFEEKVNYLKNKVYAEEKT